MKEVKGTNVIQLILDLFQENQVLNYWTEFNIVTIGDYQGYFYEFKTDINNLYGSDPVLSRTL